MTITKAKPRDREAMRAIYNEEVKTGTATLDLNEKTPEEWNAWCDAHNRDNHPLLAAHEASEVLGYACLSPYRPKDAFAGTVELSVYVAPAARGRGVGKALMQAVLDEARRDKRTHTVVSVITADNEISIALHRAFGFRPCGVLKEAAYKAGAYRDTVTFQLFV